MPHVTQRETHSQFIRSQSLVNGLVWPGPANGWLVPGCCEYLGESLNGKVVPYSILQHWMERKKSSG